MDYPANQIALAKVYTAVKGGRGKNYRSYLKTAEEFMDHLREEGFRIVPFPPLKRVTKKARKR